MPKKKKYYKVPLSIIFVIFSLAFTKELIETAYVFREGFSEKALFFIVGILLFWAIYLLSSFPKSLYIFGHELAHALSILLFGGKIYSFKIKSEGGMISTNKSNTFIALAPYFLPVYTIFLFSLYNVIDIFFNVSNFLSLYYLILGASYGFHIFCTFLYTRSYQPDLQEEGVVFSIIVIYLANVMVISLLIKIISESFSLINFYASSFISIYEGFAAFLNWFTVSSF